MNPASTTFRIWPLAHIRWKSRCSVLRTRSASFKSDRVPSRRSGRWNSNHRRRPSRSGLNSGKKVFVMWPRMSWTSLKPRRLPTRAPEPETPTKPFWSMGLSATGCRTGKMTLGFGDRSPAPVRADWAARASTHSNSNPGKQDPLGESSAVVLVREPEDLEAADLAVEAGAAVVSAAGEDRAEAAAATADFSVTGPIADEKAFTEMYPSFGTAMTP